MTVNTITYKEITRQPILWDTLSQNYTSRTKELADLISKSNFNEITFVGCGTSYYLSQVLSAATSLRLNITSSAVPASEILLHPEVVLAGDNNRLFIFVSRSGETSEVVKACKEIKGRGFVTGGFTCHEESKLSQLTDARVVIPEAAEKSVVMTSSFTSMLLLGFLLINELSEKRLHEDFSKHQNHYSKGEAVMKEVVESEEFNHLVFLGSGPLYGIANEAMLKMTEMTLTQSSAYHPFEYRHGPKSLIDKKSLVVLFTNPSNVTAELKVAKEMKELGASILVFTNGNNDIDTTFADFSIKSPLADSDQQALEYIYFIQLLGCFQANKKELNPDEPRNLTQVVTLEDDSE